MNETLEEKIKNKILVYEADISDIIQQKQN